MASELRKITAAEWDRHKNSILSLRRAGVSLKGIAARMSEKNYGFIATPSQYELQFNKWGARKNLNANEWRRILQIVDQHNEDGIKCAVYMNEEPIRPLILRRKRNQHCKGPEYARVRQARVSAAILPECIQIRPSVPDSDVTGMINHQDHEEPLTSVAYDHAMTTNEPTQFATSSYAGAVDDLETGELDLNNQMLGSNHFSQEQNPITGAVFPPSDEVQGLEPSFLDSINESQSDAFFPNMSLPIPTIGPNLSNDNCSEVAREGNSSSTRLYDATDYSTMTTLSPVRGNFALGDAPLVGPDIPLGAVSPESLMDGWIQNIPFQSVEELLGPQGYLNLGAQPGLPTQQPAFERRSHSIALENAEEAGSSPTSQTLTHTQSLFLQDGSSTSGEALLRSELVRCNLSALLTPDTVSSTSLLKSRTAARREIFGSSIYSSLILSIENNFAGLDGVPIGSVLKFLEQDPQMRSKFKKYLEATPKNVSKALAEKLIRAAIENCDAPTVREYLDTELVLPNEIVCTVDGRRYTAVERSAMLRSIEVTRVLLVAGADVNKTYENESYRERGALELAIRMWGRYSPVDMQLINMLLDCGAEVRVDLATAAVRWRDPVLIRAIMSKFSPYDHSKAFGNYWVMVDTVALLDGELATTIITQIVQACSQTGCGSCSKSNPDVLQRSTTVAAMRGHSKLVAFLLDHITDKGPPLAGAVRSGRKKTIELLLENGANADAPACSIDDPFKFVTTPLAEAIRAENDELIRELQNRGAMSQINEQGRFSAAIYAASEVGTLKYVQGLLQMAPDMDGKTLTPALNVSIIGGHEDVALTLLKAGADVNEWRSSPSPGPPLLEALRQRSKTLVREIMECDVDINAHRDCWSSDTPFMEAAAQLGDISVIKDLLSMGADINACSRETAVAAAVRSRNRPLVECLVKEHGARLDVSSGWGRSPLEAAISNKDIDMLQYLLDLGADPADPDALSKAVLQEREILAVLLKAFRARYPAGQRGFGAAALQFAFEQKDIELVDMLLEARMDVNAISRTEKFRMKSALGMAIKMYGRCNLDIIRKLILAGGDPNGVVSTTSRHDSDTVWPRRTALLQAILTKSKPLVDFLINEGADVHRAARLGLKRTPLQQASEIGALKVVELLLERGVDVNEAPALRGGGTSLQLCAINGYCRIADKLLKLGADIHAAPAEMNGKTALDGAAEHGRLDMLMLFRDATAPKGFNSEQCNRAAKLAEENGHIVCRDFLVELSLTGQGFVMPGLLNI